MVKRNRAVLTVRTHYTKILAAYVAHVRLCHTTGQRMVLRGALANTQIVLFRTSCLGDGADATAAVMEARAGRLAAMSEAETAPPAGAPTEPEPARE